MSLLGDALLSLTHAARINYEILGNSEAALHAHLFPRFDYEAAALRSKPAWFYNWDNAPVFDAVRDGALMEGLREKLADSAATAYADSTHRQPHR